MIGIQDIAGLSNAAKYPISGGKAPGNAPIKTAIGDFLLDGVYTIAYKKIENTESTPVIIFNLRRISVPAIAMNKLSTKACPVVILPDGMGLSLVRDISLSRSFSIISLKPFAAPATKNPPKVKIAQLIQFIDPCSLLPIRNDTEAEKTTRRVSLSLINFLKSDIKDSSLTQIFQKYQSLALMMNQYEKGYP